MSKQPDFNKLKKVSEAKKAMVSDAQEFSYFTVRIDRKDVNSLKYLFSERGYTIQSAIVESINTQLESWGETKRIADVGTGTKKSQSLNQKLLFKILYIQSYKKLATNKMLVSI